MLYAVVSPIIVQLWTSSVGELQRGMRPYLRIALYLFTHALQVNMCFLYVQVRHIQILHCYVCQVVNNVFILQHNLTYVTM